MHQALARAGWRSNAGGAPAVTGQLRSRAPARAREGTGVGVSDVTVTRMMAGQETSPGGMTESIRVSSGSKEIKVTFVSKGDPGWCALPAALVGDGAVTASWRSAGAPEAAAAPAG